MRHKVKGKKLGREKDVRKALMRSLAVNLVRNNKIKTTETKAKCLRPFIEKIITRAKNDTVTNRRLVISKIGVPASKNIFEKIAPMYKERKGGYTRIIKLPPRKNDASKMALIEFVK